MSIAKYIEVANELRRRILSGIYGTQGGIPVAKELAAEFNVVINTIKVALFHLEGERLIVRRGNTFYVNSLVTIMTEYVLPISERMKKRGTIGYIRTVGTVNSIKIPVHLAEMLNVSHDTIVVLQTCISGDISEQNNERPMQLSKFYYFMSVSKQQQMLMQQDGSYDILLLEAPTDLLRDDQISSRLPTREECEYLNIIDTTPVLHILSTVRNNKGDILLFQDLTRVSHATLRYQYSFENRPKT